MMDDQRIWMIRRLALLLVLIAILAFTGLRFLCLDADPPTGVTTSGVFYTDEGWYSRNASSRALGGPWIVEGDFNPVVNMPVMQLVQFLVFKIFGLHLWSARLAGVVAFFLTLLFLFKALRKLLNEEIVLVILLFLASNYLWFSFSRIAVAENLMMMFLAASFLFALDRAGSRGARNGAWAGMFLGLAVLTKLVALFFLPVMIVLFAIEGEPSQSSVNKVTTTNFGKGFLVRTAAACAVFLVGMGVYMIALVLPHMGDFRYFNTLNISSRLVAAGEVSPMMKAVYVIKGSLLRKVQLNLFLYFGGMAGCGLVVLWSRLRRDPLLMAMVLWVACYLLVIAIYGYGPPRYYIPVLIPLTVVLVRIGFTFSALASKKLHFRAAAWLVAAILFASLLTNGHRVLRYMERPAYSFLDMSQEIGAIAAEGESPVLMGHFANSVGLEAAVSTLNDTYGTWPISRRIDAHLPGYYLCYGPIESIDAKDHSYKSAAWIRQHASPEFIKKFDVLENYYNGRAVYLYRLTYRGE